MTSWFGGGDVTGREEPEPRRVLEHEPDLRLVDRQVLAGADEERHAVPAPVVDPQLQRDVRLRRRRLLHARRPEVARVLAADVVLRVRGGHGAEHRRHPVLQRLRITAGRRLHRRRPDDLHDVVDHDVAQRPDGVVEAAAGLDAEVLGHRDLDARDVQPVPDRLEHRVGEAQVEHLVQAHLAQEVVDAQELGLVEVAVHLGVERAGGGEVVAERLLHDDARVLRQPRLREAADDRAEQGGRDLEVEHRRGRVARSRRGRARRSPGP